MDSSLQNDDCDNQETGSGISWVSTEEGLSGAEESSTADEQSSDTEAIRSDEEAVSCPGANDDAATGGRKLVSIFQMFADVRKTDMFADTALLYFESNSSLEHCVLYRYIHHSTFSRVSRHTSSFLSSLHFHASSEIASPCLLLIS